jgi:hypothetical protein
MFVSFFTICWLLSFREILIFFLLASSQPVLRRMVYLSIKSLNTKQEEVLIVTSSLCQDINGKVDNFRANALRVLAHVIDVPISVFYCLFFEFCF